jgi:hypothetical protein
LAFYEDTNYALLPHANKRKTTENQLKKNYQKKITAQNIDYDNFTK